MNHFETTKTLSKEERKLITSLLEKYTREEIEMALRHLNNSKIINKYRMDDFFMPFEDEAIELN